MIRPAVACGLLAALVLASPAEAERAAAATGAGLARARQLSWDQHYDESIRLYRELLAHSPHDATLQRELGQVLLWAGREREAAPHLEAALAAAPRDLEARLALARALQYAGRVREAVGHYAWVLPQRPDDAALWAEAIAVARWADRPRLAHRWLQAARARHPESADLAAEHAAELLERGELGAAERELEAVLAAHPSHERARELAARVRRERADPVALARRLGNAGRLGEAKRRLRSRLAEHPDDPQALEWLARFESWSGELGRASRHYRALLRLRPDDRDARLDLAEVESWRGDLESARRRVERELALTPGDRRAERIRLDLDLWSGAEEAAARRLARLRARWPDDRELRERERELELRRRPALRAESVFFRDSDGFRLIAPRLDAEIAPRPGRRLVAWLETPRVEGRRASQGRGTERETHQGRALGLAFSWRPDRALAWRGGLGAVRYAGRRLHPRARLAASWHPDLRQSVELELRYGEAAAEARTLESLLDDLTLARAELSHSFDGLHLHTWSSLQAGRYSDGPSYWTAQTSIGWRIWERPALDLVGTLTAGDFERGSPAYWSPHDLLAWALGLRVQQRFGDRFELRIEAERGVLRTSAGRGATLHLAPELLWTVSRRFELRLGWDRFDSFRAGSYHSDQVALELRARLGGLP